MQELRLAHEALEKRYAETNHELRCEKAKNEDKQETMSPSLSEKMAEMHSELKVNQMRVQSMKDQVRERDSELQIYREKERQWKHERARLEDQIDSITAKAQEAGNLCVTINGSPVDLSEVLQTNGRLEGEVQNLSTLVERYKADLVKKDDSAQKLRAQVEAKDQEKMQIFVQLQEKEQHLHRLRHEIKMMCPLRTRTQIVDVVEQYDGNNPSDMMKCSELQKLLRRLTVPYWKRGDMATRYMEDRKLREDGEFRKSKFIEWFFQQQKELTQPEDMDKASAAAIH